MDKREKNKQLDLFEYDDLNSLNICYQAYKDKLKEISKKDNCIVTFFKNGILVHCGIYLHDDKILHTDAIAPCVSKNIPIVLKNFYNLQCKGTIVCNEKCKNFLINGIVKLDNVNVETISLNEFADIFDIASRIQKLLKTHEDSLITLSQNIKQKRICILTKSGSSEKIYNEINNFLSQNKNGTSIVIGDTKSMITICLYFFDFARFNFIH